MWRNYSADYIRQNRASGFAIMTAAFIAALFISFLGSLFYNFWLDNVEGAKLENGDWHGRVTGEIGEDDLATIRNFANVKNAKANADLSDENQTAVDILFDNKRTVYRDMNRIVNILGLEEDAAQYNYQLLSLYFVRIPGDDMPRLLMPAYLAIVALVCFSLILVIHNSFAVSMNSRIHQFGIFSSIGATPGQIRSCLLQEAFMLSLLPILAGLFLGVVFSFGTVQAMNAFVANLAGGRQSPFGWHPVILAVIFLLAVLTVLVSAWIPARKLSRLTPLEAIRGTGELQLKKKKNSRVLSALFGMEGELAGNALRAQRKALRATSWSLTFAFLGFMLMQCFWTLSGISTNHTYFEKYQDAWDVMVTIKDTGIEDFTLIEEVKELSGCGSIVYQKAQAACVLPEEAQSRELLELGGLRAFAGDFLAKALMVIMDDASFGEFCGQIGIDSRLDGTIILNRFWDSKNSNFRYPKYVPYVKDDLGAVAMQNASGKGEAGSPFVTEIPVLACTAESPLLREEYEKSDYPLVQFVPLSLWTSISGQIGGAEHDMYIRTLAEDRESLDSLDALEGGLAQALGEEYEIESENRIQEKLDNDIMIWGYKMVLGAFCVLLAVIGIAHVFSNTLGFLRQRKREFARYMSVGLTPAGMRKMFCIEALAIAGRPMLAAFLLTAAVSALMIKASYLDPMEFIRVAPVEPVLAFILAVFGFVALAYYLGGKRMMKVELAEALRDDTVM